MGPFLTTTPKLGISASDDILAFFWVIMLVRSSGKGFLGEELQKKMLCLINLKNARVLFMKTLTMLHVHT